MFDQTLIRICLILGSLITAGYILRRVRQAKVQIEDTIFWLLFRLVPNRYVPARHALFGAALENVLPAVSRDVLGSGPDAGALADRVRSGGDTMSEDLRRQIAVAAATAPRGVVLDSIERSVADRHEGVDIGKLKHAANDLMAALLVDLATDRRG